MTDLSRFEDALRARSGGRCELCGAEDGVTVLEVKGAPEPSPEHCLMACAPCRQQLADGAELDATHWFCLKETAWSEVPAVQVVSWRVLHRLTGHAWAQDLLEQLYLPDDVLEWARAGQRGASSGEATARTVDSNGTELASGDSVTLIKDLDVKGAGFVAKRGTLVKNIRLTDDPELVEGRVNKVAIVLKTPFLKKV